MAHLPAEMMQSDLINGTHIETAWMIGKQIEIAENTTFYPNARTTMRHNSRQHIKLISQKTPDGDIVHLALRLEFPKDALLGRSNPGPPPGYLESEDA